MMLTLLFLLSVFYVGYILTKKIGASFIVGSLLCVTAIFILLFLSHSLFLSLIIYSVGFLVLFVVTFKEVIKRVRGQYDIPQVVLYAVLFTLFFLLFTKSFSYDTANHSFLIQSNLYQDFGGRIAHIRYFSFGHAFIPEVPYFAGGRALYHFMFEFYAGILEYLGLRIDFALNIISAFSFASLIFLLFEFASRLFKNKFVGILTPMLFVFISDFSFIQLFQKYSFSFSSFYHHSTYVVGEFMGLEMGRNFLNINTYLNQRHLVFGLGVFLYILHLALFKEKKLSDRPLVFTAILIGLLPFWHIQMLLALYMVLNVALILFKDLRNSIIKIIYFSAILAVPQLLLLKLNSVNQVLFNPGFTIHDKFSLQSFSLYWIWNLGFAIPLALFGLLVSNKFQRKIFLCFLSLFVIANLFKLSHDMFDNHKFLNTWIISINMFAGYGVYRLFKKGILFKSVAIVGIILLTISGVFHMLVVKNDVYARIPDSLQTKFGSWIKDNIKPQDSILTNGEIYDPASLAGARTFLGRPHYVFLFGGDPSKRILEKNIVLSGVDDKKVHTIIRINRITYIIIYKEGTAPNLSSGNIIYFDRNFKKVYEDDTAIIYKI